GATLSCTMLGSCFSGGSGMLSVMTSCLIGASRSRWIALPTRTPCVAPTHTSRAPFTLALSTAPTTPLPVHRMSSDSTTALPRRRVHRRADARGLLRLGCAGAALVHDGDGAAELLLVDQRLLDAALVGAEHDEVAQRDLQRAHVLVDDRAGVQVVDGDVEEAL